MTPPLGIRAESSRTPDASRAGALHSHIHSHMHRQDSGAKAPSIGSVVEGRRPRRWMAADAEIGGLS